ncbi:hypothetical protein NLU13_1262 [Sarocladium strictum]|uniref:Zn(2)-C6 fungal-type domain-containing protein n=1 Tax=Sarocladium strictum TaxID=5046 RepID=A0AA39GQM0_SARSR|nr:hypothetical protein NLU13_1262 [Sarocladium strictum]
MSHGFPALSHARDDALVVQLERERFPRPPIQFIHSPTPRFFGFRRTNFAASSLRSGRWAKLSTAAPEPGPNFGFLVFFSTATMTEVITDWMHFNGRQPKRKRALVTCVDCHARKVKCDLQARTAQGQSGCSNCLTAERSCHLRPSKRNKQSRISGPPQQQVHQRQQQEQQQEEEEEEEQHHHHHRARSSSPPAMHRPEPPKRDAYVPEVARAQPEPGPQFTEPSPRQHFYQQLQRQQQQLQHPHPHPHQHQHHHFPPPPHPHTDSPQSQRTSSGRPHGPPTSQSNPSDVDIGFLQVYGPENQHDAEQHEHMEGSVQRHRDLSDAQQPELQEIFSETYFEFCYTWCPVLDMDTITEAVHSSPLLANALAVAASHIRPPLIPHEGPAMYYKRATHILYDDEEPDGMTTLQAISLFYWWAPRPPNTARRHSSWWWTSVLIRQAQQMNYHREPGPNYPLKDPAIHSLRRKIWWTAFARERLTALCQSKPCIIDPDDCNVQELTLADFPGDPIMQRKGEVFIYWVRLCAIIGRIAKTLARAGSSTSSSLPSTTELRQELVDWIRSVPPHLRLPINSARTRWFDRDVHQLYLPYLTTIIILHLRRSTHALPQALPPAIVAASCIVRILKDILSRGDARFLMAITCWYSGTAFIALIQACRIENLRKDANDGLDVLTNTVAQLQRMWGSANVIRRGFDRLRESNLHGGANGGEASRNVNVPHQHVSATNHAVPVEPERAAAQDVIADPSPDFDWTQLFPFVSRDTGSIVAALLPSNEPGAPTRLPSPEDMVLQDIFTMDYQGLLEPMTDFTDFGFGL